MLQTGGQLLSRRIKKVSFFRLFEQISAHHHSVFSGCNYLGLEKDNSAGDDNGFHFFTVLGTNLTGVFLHVKSSGLVSVDCRKVGDIICFASYIEYDLPPPNPPCGLRLFHVLITYTDTKAKCRHLKK
jgi:hypothetical protein